VGFAANSACSRRELRGKLDGTREFRRADLGQRPFEIERLPEAVALARVELQCDDLVEVARVGRRSLTLSSGGATRR